MLGMAERFVEGFNVDVDTLCFEDIKDVGPGGNFFTSKHTLKNYRDGYFLPEVLDSQTFEQWAESGSKSSAELAMLKRKDLLNKYEPPAIELAMKDELNDFVERSRKV